MIVGHILYIGLWWFTLKPVEMWRLNATLGRRIPAKFLSSSAQRVGSRRTPATNPAILSRKFNELWISRSSLKSVVNKINGLSYVGSNHTQPTHACHPLNTHHCPLGNLQRPLGLGIENCPSCPIRDVAGVVASRPSWVERRHRCKAGPVVLGWLLRGGSTAIRPSPLCTNEDERVRRLCLNSRKGRPRCSGLSF
jgi:hypothetical protein